MLIASALVVTGLVISALSLQEIRATSSGRMAEATQPLQTSPPAPAAKIAAPIRQK